MPNWYRWLLIGTGSLILCACRAPRELELNQPSPLMPEALADHQTGLGRLPPPLPVSADAPPSSASRPATPLDRSSLAARRLRQVRAEIPVSADLEDAARQTSLAPIILKSARDQEQTAETAVARWVSDAPPEDVTPKNSPAPLEHEPKTRDAPQAYGDEETDDAEELHDPEEDPEEDPEDQAEAVGPTARTARVVNAAIPEADEPSETDGLTNIEPADEDEQIVDPELTTDGQVILADIVPIGNDTEKAPISVAPVSGEAVVDAHFAGAEVQDLTHCPPAETLHRFDPARAYPDEYICDGGDAAGRVTVLSDGSVRDLDPSDTVGHFEGSDDGVTVQPSNRVCIYAPRFAATRHVTAAVQAEERLQPLTAEQPTAAVTDQRRQGTDLFLQNTAVEGQATFQQASAYRGRLPGIEAIQHRRLIVVDKDLSLHEKLRVMRYGVHHQRERAMLAELSQAAIAWSHDTALQVIFDGVEARTEGTVRAVDEIFGLEKRGAPKLRVIKTASAADALPGEEVEFHLRFDNVGRQEMDNLVLIDHLVTRLEYVEGSAECSVPAEFFTDENKSDSLTLRWKITEPLKPGEGGLIRFTCRVR